MWIGITLRALQSQANQTIAPLIGVEVPSPIHTGDKVWLGQSLSR
jgi:hypothetical protein